MRDTVALRRYLHRHTEQGLPAHIFAQPYWHQVLVVPTYRESPALLEQLTRIPSSEGITLVILVLNRPDSDHDTLANAALRDALAQSDLPRATRGPVSVHCLNTKTDLYLYDLEKLRGPTPRAQGVGLARKIGCDLALQWRSAGGISGQWLCSTDADALLPQTYFAQLAQATPKAAAAVFPFRHIASADEACNTATALYELRLHHYVLGLEYAGSPYAFHTLGSSLAIPFSAYAHVHGFPKRAGAEDFYLLNKLAKLGPVARLQGPCIELQSRVSARVPFGTGPAVAALTAAAQPLDSALFYHPQSFAALAALLALLPVLADRPEQNLAELMSDRGYWGKTAANALNSLGIASALDHCQRHASSSEQFIRHFHQWFDGFRTLKFLHALRDDGLPLCSLAELNELAPPLWPVTEKRCTAQEIELGQADATSPKMGALQHTVRQHWGWR
ncbi:Uncharacterised protein [Halioglobus japonicus]|nr:Uncharacterised protein [Halioglobus japonicus]